ncbi:hypothetical protein Acr_20g0010260 [Actinidia rufa]|uniref:Uncharacterized protein n=1 Tax=Actinidia rufa TaxID=165716 RepID=A0A7J0GET0_9ERIC|nr:hypothetical protein Acr_20g0010260 [Actinidia rufa]
MQRLLRARKFLKYITDDAQPPYLPKDDGDDSYAKYQSQLEDWDINNSKIITCSSLPGPIPQMQPPFMPTETVLIYIISSWLFFLIMSIHRLLFFIVIPLPTIGQDLAELRFEETHKKTMASHQHSQPVLSIPSWSPLPPSFQPVRSTSSKTIPSSSQKKYCSFCRRDNHSFEECRSRNKPKRKGSYYRQTAVVTDSIGPSLDSSSSSALTAANVEIIVT